jgi:tRNA(fMet)-specific endonuclease VapC
MAHYILDTDTLSHYQHSHLRVTPTVDAFPAGALGVTIITVEEQFIGWYSLLRQTKHPDRLAWAYEGFTRAAASLTRFTVLTYTEPAIHRFDQLLKLKLGIGKPDLRIAAIALELNATVVTCNTKHFGRVPGLTVVDWSV